MHPDKPKSKTMYTLAVILDNKDISEIPDGDMISFLGT